MKLRVTLLILIQFLIRHHLFLLSFFKPLFNSGIQLKFRIFLHQILLRLIPVRLKQPLQTSEETVLLIFMHVSHECVLGDFVTPDAHSNTYQNRFFGNLVVSFLRDVLAEEFNDASNLEFLLFLLEALLNVGEIFAGPI